MRHRSPASRRRRGLRAVAGALVARRARPTRQRRRGACARARVRGAALLRRSRRAAASPRARRSPASAKRVHQSRVLELAFELAAPAAQVEEIVAGAKARMLEQPVRTLAGALLEARLQRPDLLDRRLEAARDRDLLRLLRRARVSIASNSAGNRLSAAGFAPPSTSRAPRARAASRTGTPGDTPCPRARARRCRRARAR